MLTKIIVGAYETLIEIALWLFLIGFLIAGWVFGSEVFDNGVLGAIVGLLGGFIVAVMFFGAFLILIDIRSSVKAIENKIKCQPEKN